MEKRTIIILLAFVFAIVLAIIFLGIFLLPSEKVLSPDIGCNTIKESNRDGVNIVYFADERIAEEYTEYFLEQEPFNEHKEKFNFYQIDEKPECELYQGIALLCNSRENIKKSSACPNDYIVIIKDQPPNIRSSAYMNIMSLNSNHPKSVFIHEFGHAFVNLADEYVPANLPRGSENCKEDPKYFIEGSDYYQGCSKQDYYRSIKNGVMRTLSSNKYGNYNSQLIEEKIKESPSLFQLPLTGRIIEEEKPQEYYLITGEYHEGEITLINKTKEKGFVGEHGKGTFTYTVRVGEKEYLENFNPELIFTDYEVDGETTGDALEYSGEFHLKVPIVENIKEITIKDYDEKELIKVNLELHNRPCKV